MNRTSRFRFWWSYRWLTRRAMVLLTDWFDVLKDATLLLTRLPPTQICKLKISAIHRNTDPSTSFHFSLFFYLFLITLTAVTNKITQFFIWTVVTGNSMNTKHNVTIPRNGYRFFSFVALDYRIWINTNIWSRLNKDNDVDDGKTYRVNLCSDTTW